MIIGRDILEFLGIDILFSKRTIKWDFHEIPFKDQDSPRTDFLIEEPEAVADANKRLKKILDAKYKRADLEEVCTNQTELTVQHTVDMVTIGATPCYRIYDFDGLE